MEAYLNRPDNVVVAAVRDPAHHTSKTLYDLPKASSSSVIVVKIESLSETDPADAISELRSTHNITAIDIVIANAGIVKGFRRVEDAQTADLLEHYHVNAIGAVILFRAVLPLLKNSQKTPKFIAMGTSAASIEEQEKAPVPNAVYGPSKAALNWLVKKIHLENEDLVAFPIHPGYAFPSRGYRIETLTGTFWHSWVQTEMGNESARGFGLEKADITLEESINGLVKVVRGHKEESIPSSCEKHLAN